MSTAENPSPEITLEVKIPVGVLKERIAQLSVTEDGEPLKNAMSDLKKALLENPEACALLLPEDIGECFKAIKRMTFKEIEEDATPTKEKKAKVPNLKNVTQEDLKELKDDDFL